MQPNEEQTLRRAARAALSGEIRYITIGRSRNRAGVTRSTPVAIIEGDSAPKLLGKPYLKTQFRNGAFSKTMYTPSTLMILVGPELGG